MPSNYETPRHSRPQTNPAYSNSRGQHAGQRTNSGAGAYTGSHANHSRYAVDSTYRQSYDDYGYIDDGRTGGASSIRKVVTIVASVIYWPIALIGVSAPFLPGFNPGGLHMWQAVFSRFWLAFALLGFVYALVIDLGSIRSSGFLGGRPSKIAIAIVADLALSFVLLRIMCLL